MDDITPEDQPPEENIAQSDEESDEIENTQEVASMDESIPQSDEQPAELYITQNAELQEERNSQWDENIEELSSSQAEETLEDNIPQPVEETEETYTAQEGQPLAESNPQSGEETGEVNNTQEAESLDNYLQSIDESGEIYNPQDVEPLEAIDPQLIEENEAVYTTQEFQPLSESILQSEDSAGEAYTAQEIQALEENNPGIDIPAAEVLVAQEVSLQENPKKIALILSGGGARGVFQVGAEKYAREVKGYRWDIIAGVSVGAANGAMLAMHRYSRLMEIWNTITNEQVYRGGFNLLSLIRLLFGARSFYSNVPLQRMMESELKAGKVIDELRVGAVSLISGKYQSFTKEFLELPKAILASTSMPVIWPPVDISAEHPAMVDGGVRNITPIGDVLKLEPDEIVIINCSAEQPAQAPKASTNALSIGLRTLDIMQNEIFVSDMKEFLRINALVKEAEQQGIVLHHPQTGKPLKYYPCVIIEPDGELGGILDFSKGSIQTALRMGVRRAREVLGRPGATKV